MNQRPAQLNWATLILDGVSPTAKAIVGFNNDSSKSTLLEVAGSCDSCKSTANSDNTSGLKMRSIWTMLI
ncbi:hypothetical protein KR52_06770 [Synechococcus sp. KORDI-52]|nr:hypothetical protein KR52_06770 [Synechococcus sp. KORDI-52]